MAKSRRSANVFMDTANNAGIILHSGPFFKTHPDAKLVCVTLFEVTMLQATMF